MNETIQQTWGEMLGDYPSISGWILEAVKSGMIAGCVLLVVWFLARRSALSRSWVIRMGFLALGIATVWNFVPESGRNSQPRILVEVSAPQPSISQPSVSPAEVPDLPIPDVEMEYNAELVKSPKAIVEAAQQVGLDVEKSPFSLKLWIEGNLKLIWFGIALFIALWLAVRYLAGALWLRRIGRPVGDKIRRLVEETTTSLRVQRTVRCRLVEGLGSPLITGWWHANIWLPDHVVEMPPAHQRAIIEHELAHFRRNDFPWQTYASLMAAFWWWNPLVFLLLRKLKSEAELVADEAVVSGGSAGADYAEALVKVAAGASYVPRRQIGVPMLGRSSIEKRVKGIVSENPFRNRIGWIASLMIGLVAVGGGMLASFTAVAQQRNNAAAESGETTLSDDDSQELLTGEGASALSCLVVNQDGTPVEGAEVYFELMRMPHGEIAVPLKFVGRTDATGEYEILVDQKFGLPENLRYSIFVRHSDHGSSALGGISRSWQDPKKFQLSKGFPLKFRVIDEDGNPVRNLDLRVASASLPGDDVDFRLTDFWGEVPELPKGFWNATTDLEGRCVIVGLPAGRYYVDHDEEKFAQFPGAHHGKFQHVAVANGKEIELKALPAAAVSGTVRYPDGNPVLGARVKILEHYHYTQGGCSAETITDSDGRYKLARLLPSNYDIKVIVGKDIRDSWTADIRPIEIAKGEEKTDFDFELEKGGIVKGRVTLGDTGAPVPNYQVGATSQKGASPLHLWWIIADENGYYQSRIPAGKRRVYPGGLNPEGYTTQKSDRSQMGVDIDVKEGGTYNNDFALLSETGIRGIVVNAAGDPVAGASVTCYDPPDRMSHPMKTESDEEGRFSFIFPAGTKKAGIFAEFEGQISKPGVKFPVASEAKVVVGETQWARVRGRVVDVNDQPIEGARVSWSSRFGIEKQSYEAMTDAEGYFESKMLPENTHITFWATKESFGTDAAQASFKDGEAVKLDPIRLKPANASIRGTVVDVDGRPVAGAKVEALGDQQNEYISVTTDENGDFTISGLVDGWMDLQIQKSTIVMRSRLRMQPDMKKIVFRNKYHRVIRREPISFVGKPAPLLVGETWFNTDPLPAESKGKVRLVCFVGFDRSLQYHTRMVKALEKIRKETPDKNLEIILVHSNWPKQEIKEILKSDFPDFKLPLVIEPEEGSMSEKFGLGNWLSVVIDQTGKVAFQGTWKWDEAQNQVRLLLGNPNNAAVEKEVVPVQIGAKAFRDGDVVQIAEVLSTSKNLEPGDTVTVRGRYRLDSVESARLMLLLTQTESDGQEETDKQQIVSAKRGWHEFETTITVKHHGFLHLTFYDEVGEPIGGVYFGTPTQMAKADGLSIEHYKIDR